MPDNRLGIAQLSNRLLIPPDALTFQDNPDGEFLGYTYMALPFTEPTTSDPPTGDQSWTCFLSAANFKGPIAYYIPETWSKIGKLFNYPFIYGRGLDARPGRMGGGAMEINTVPRFDARNAHGTIYSKLPKLQFPVDDKGQSLLVQDVTYYSKAALYDAVKAWRDGGPACSGVFKSDGAWKATLTTRTPGFDLAGQKIVGVSQVFDTAVFDGNVWGLQWRQNKISPIGIYPQYFKHVDDTCVAIEPTSVPSETGFARNSSPWPVPVSRTRRRTPARGANQVRCGAPLLWIWPTVHASPTVGIALSTSRHSSSTRGTMKRRPDCNGWLKRSTAVGLSIETIWHLLPAASS